MMHAAAAAEAAEKASGAALSLSRGKRSNRRGETAAQGAARRLTQAKIRVTPLAGGVGSGKRPQIGRGPVDTSAPTNSPRRHRARVALTGSSDSEQEQKDNPFTIAERRFRRKTRGTE